MNRIDRIKSIVALVAFGTRSFFADTLAIRRPALAVAFDDELAVDEAFGAQGARELIELEGAEVTWLYAITLETGDELLYGSNN